jgi:hypothetical protein
MRISRLCFFWVALLMAGTASGQNVIPMRIQGQPLVYMKEGKVDGCGIRFVMVDAPPKFTDTTKITMYDVSFNIYTSGLALIKGGASDATSADFKAGNYSTAKPVLLKTLWIKARGNEATTPLTGMKRSDDPGMITYVADEERVAALFVALAKEEPILVGTQRPEAKSERIFSGKIDVTHSELQEISACVKQLWSKP